MKVNYRKKKIISRGPRKSIAVSSGPRCERTFVTFENDINESAFNSIFTPTKKRRNGGYICSITKMPARYFDPITRLPYRNKEAFKVIREAYYQYLEAWADPKLLDLEKWLAFRTKVCFCVASKKLLALPNLILKFYLLSPGQGTENQIEEIEPCARCLGWRTHSLFPINKFQKKLKFFLNLEMNSRVNANGIIKYKPRHYWRYIYSLTKRFIVHIGKYLNL